MKTFNKCMVVMSFLIVTLIMMILTDLGIRVVLDPNPNFMNAVWNPITIVMFLIIGALPIVMLTGLVSLWNEKRKQTNKRLEEYDSY